MGNKAKLLNEIESFVSAKVNKEKPVFLDIFGGSGSVSEFFSEKYKVISNDILYFSKCLLVLKTKFSNKDLDSYIAKMNSLKPKRGYVANSFSPIGPKGRMYFSTENAKKIDAAMTYIQTINDIDLKEALTGVVIESISKVANIAGVYGAYLKTWDKRALKSLNFEIGTLNPKYKKTNKVYSDDANEIIKNVYADILYMDPPYTKNDYTTQYHVLETIARYDKPELIGITGTRPNKVKSEYAKTRYAEKAFVNLINNANQKHIFISYSSDGIISEKFMINALKRISVKGTFTKKKIAYRKYTNSKSKSKDIFEYIFYVEKDKMPIYQSPLNYMGNKKDIMKQIMPFLPNKYNNVFDLFGGGMNFSINVGLKGKVIYNEINPFVFALIKAFSNTDPVIFTTEIEKLIKKYGLEVDRKKGYSEIRNSFNNDDEINIYKLYTMILYSFNQQFRFNSNHKFNNTLGQSGWNESTKEKLFSFSEKVSKQDMVFLNEDYIDVIHMIRKGDFVYVDPPYLITLGSYNDGKRGFNGWDHKQDSRLLNELLSMDKKGIKFMMSNVLEHKDKKNLELMKWVKKNGFKVIKINHSKRKEVLIVNY